MNPQKRSENGRVTVLIKFKVAETQFLVLNNDESCLHLPNRWFHVRKFILHNTRPFINFIKESYERYKQ